MGDRWLYAWGLGSVALGGASLIVPLYIVQLGGSAYTLGLLGASAAFAGVPGALLVGPLVDRGGRHREIVLASLGLIGVTLLAMPLIEYIPLIVGLNAAVWLAFASAFPVLTLLVVTGTPEAAWSERIARLYVFQGIGWTLGLVVGAVVTGAAGIVLDSLAAQRLLLGLYAASASLGLIAAARWLPRGVDESVGGGRRVRRAFLRAGRFNVRAATFPFTPSSVDVRGLHPERLVHRFTPTLASYFVALFLCFAGFAAFFAPLPAFLNEAAVTDGEIFVLYVILSVASALCFGWAGELGRRYGALPVQSLGLGLRAIALPAVAVIVGVLGVEVFGLTVIGAVFVVIGISWALIIVTAGTLVAQLAPPTIRGEALGVYGALTAFAGGVGSILGGRLALVSYPVAFAVAGGLVATAGLLVLGLHRRTHTGTVDVVSDAA